MLRNSRKFSFTLALGTILWHILIAGAIADDDKPAPETKPEEASISEDDISTRKGMPWGGGNFSYSQTLTIKDSLVSTPVGMVILDKHGIDDSKSGSGSLESSLLGALIPFESPFSSPVPGKSVFITLWGSKIEGCFVEAIVQVAPDEEIVAKSIAPTMLELGVNNQIIQLTPQKNAKPKVGSFAYKYTENKQKRDAKWYMARQIFAIDSGTAKLLSNAPAQEIKARLDFGDDDSMIVPIGKGTVQGWKKAYSFNPACSAKK
jgi:hypothetical protein